MRRRTVELALAEMLDSPIPTLHDNAPSVLQAILGIDSVPDESRFKPEFWKAIIEEQP